MKPLRALPVLAVLLLACPGGDLPVDDDDSTEPPCATAGVIDLGGAGDAPIPLFYWGGNPAPAGAPLSTTVTTPPCGAFRAETDAAWLAPSIDADGSSLSVSIVVENVVSGRSSGVVEIVDDAGVAATFSIALSALVSRSGTTPKALVVGIDGVDSDAQAGQSQPTWDLLATGGVWAPAARTQLTGATSSGPGWTTVLTGVEVEKHGVTSNGGYSGRDPQYLTFPKRLKDELDLSVMAAIQWADIFLILEDDILDASSGGSQPIVRDAAASWILDDDPDLVFVHLDDVDGAGHASGFVPSSEQYVAALEQADADVGVLLDAILDRPGVADEDWLIVVTTDHGGTAGGSHGAMTLDCQVIPTVAAGGRQPKTELGWGQGSHTDVHATVLAHFGLEPDDYALDGGVLGTLREIECDDGLDDDGDGLVDCDDPECAAFTTCWSCTADDNLESAIGELTTLSPTDNRMVGSCGGDDGDDVILTWTAPAAGTYVFDTMQWYRDTVLYVQDAVCEATELACNDSPAGTARSVVSLPLGANEEVVVVVDTDGGSSETTGLSIRPNSTTCPDAALTAGTGGTAESFTHAETAWAGSCPPVISDRWFSWTAPTAGDWTFDTAGSDFDTVLYVLDACGGSELGCNDDDGGLTSSVTVTLGQGDSVVVGAGSFAGRAATGSLVINTSN